MSDVKSIVARFGRKQIAAKVRRTESAVGNAIADGSFPAAWYPAIREMCAEQGVECPERAFAFRWPETAETGSAT